MKKPLGMKAYGHIPHLPGSRRGPGDHRVHDGQGRIATVKTRDKHDRVVVQEKLDGSCCAVAIIGDEVIALGRSGHRAFESPYEQQKMFAKWVVANQSRFRKILLPGERAVGEWLAQAHGTRYDLPHEPFVLFDIISGQQAGGNQNRLPHDEFMERCDGPFTVPRVIFDGFQSWSIQSVLRTLEPSGHGAIDPVEGAVWRIERKGMVDFLCKFVRHEKIDGKYLPQVSGAAPVWNWRPGRNDRIERRMD